MPLHFLDCRNFEDFKIMLEELREFLGETD